MKTRILTALLIILVVAFPVLYGGWPLEALALFIIGASAWEWLRILPNYSKWNWLLPILIVGVIATRFVEGNWRFVLVACMILFLWSIPVFTSSFTSDDCNAAIVYYVLFSLFYTTL